MARQRDDRGRTGWRAAWPVALLMSGSWQACLLATPSGGDDVTNDRGGTPRLHKLSLTSDDVAQTRAALDAREAPRPAVSAPPAAQDEVPPPSYGTPSSSSSPCHKGQIEFDARYIYTCIATNAWTRAITSSF